MTAPTALNTQTARTLASGGTVGIAPAATDATNGNTFVQDGHTLLRFSGTPGGTVAFSYPVTVDGQTVPNKVVTIPAAGVVWVYVAPSSLYGGKGVVPFKSSAVGILVEVVNF